MGSDEQLGYSRKTKQERGVLQTNFLITPPEFFIFLLYTSKFQTKERSTPKGPLLKIPQNCVSCIPQKFQGQKPGPLEIPHYFFFFTILGNSTQFLINPIPHAISLISLEIPYPHPTSPPVFFFLEQPLISVAVKMKLYMVGGKAFIISDTAADKWLFGWVTKLMLNTSHPVS